MRICKNHVMLLLAVLMMIMPAIPAAKPSVIKPCVEKIHVIYGCSTCEAMLDWLRKGGVTIDMTDVQSGPYRLYPTVLYSNKTADNGEAMYKQQVTIPEKVCVIRCNVGMN